MEENTNSTIPFYFPKEYKSIVSIIGIGGGAGRIVNEMPKTEHTHPLRTLNPPTIIAK